MQESFKEAWTQGIESEVAFWRQWFASKGGEWPDDYATRLDPRLPLQDFFAELRPAGAHFRILDVGSGPLTFVGKTLEGVQVEVVAVDALADAYTRIIDEAGVVPPVRVQRCDTECLTDLFPPMSFDVSYARNTLDHSYDPVLAIRKMLEVTKPGGFVLLEHYQNEAAAENYSGLHQLNLEAHPKGLRIWRPDGEVQLMDRVDDLAVLRSVTLDLNMPRVLLQRRDV